MATNWIVIVDADLNDYLVGVQVDAFRTLLLSGGQVNPFAKISHDVATRIRAKIQSAAENQNIVSATVDAIPPECKWIACYLILDALQGRFPDLDLSKHQQSQIAEAVRQLDRISDGKDLVTIPTDPLPTDVQTGSPILVIDTSLQTSRRLWTTKTMQGL